MNTLADVLVFALHLLPVKEESQLQQMLTAVENARPALDKLVEDFKNSTKTVVEDVVGEAETVAADVVDVVKGL